VPRHLAAEALARIEGGAYANLVLPAMLAASPLSERDRHLVTELVYGTARMRRACDWVIDRLCTRRLDTPTRVALRLGVYQLGWTEIPPHAAVSESVEVAPARARRLVNAVLRRIAETGVPGPDGWPSDAVRLSYPDWVAERVVADLGAGDGWVALAAMNEAPVVTPRPDGYVQDLASQWAAAAVGAHAGERVLDVCAAPGGKATALARSAAFLVAADRRPARARLVVANAARLGLPNIAVVVGDGTAPSFRAAGFDRVLVDAPCSGLGVLRRRADARWRVRPEAVNALVALQQRLLAGAAELVRPGGTIVYCVCTLTAAETREVDLREWPAVEGPPPGEGWRRWGRGWLVLPQAAGTDGMFVLRLVRPERS